MEISTLSGTKVTRKWIRNNVLLHLLVQVESLVALELPLLFYWEKPFAAVADVRSIASHCPLAGWGWRGLLSPAPWRFSQAPVPLFPNSLRSGCDIQDYSLTGYVWSAVTPSPEHLGDEVNLKVTVLCDSLREPLTFTCNCKCGLKEPFILILAFPFGPHMKPWGSLSGRLALRPVFRVNPSLFACSVGLEVRPGNAKLRMGGWDGEQSPV